MSLRQLTRRLRPGTLSGFWQGRYNIQPWQEMQTVQQANGQEATTREDIGFSTFSRVTNPSIGLDSVYQKHVFSRLEPVQAGTEGGSGDGGSGGHNAGGSTTAAAAIAMLHPAAAAAAATGRCWQDDDEGDGAAGTGLSGGDVEGDRDYILPVEAALCDGAALLAVESMVDALSGCAALIRSEKQAERNGAAGAEVMGEISRAPVPVRDPHGVRNRLRLPTAPGQATAPEQAGAPEAAPSDAAAVRAETTESAATTDVPVRVAAETAGRATKGAEAGQRDDAGGVAALPEQAPAGGDEATVGLLWSVPEDAVSVRRPPQSKPHAGARGSRRSAKGGKAAPRRTQSAIQPAHAPGYVGKPKAQVASGDKAKKGRKRRSKGQAGSATGSAGKSRGRVDGEMKEGQEAPERRVQDAGGDAAGGARHLSQNASSNGLAAREAASAAPAAPSASATAREASGYGAQASVISAATAAPPVPSALAPALATSASVAASPVSTERIHWQSSAAVVTVTQASMQRSPKGSCRVATSQVPAGLEGRRQGFTIAEPAAAALVPQEAQSPACLQVPLPSTIVPATQEQRQLAPLLSVTPQARPQLDQQQQAAGRREHLIRQQAAGEAQRRFLERSREALALLLDEALLEEDVAAAAGVLTARGSVHGAPAYAFCAAFPSPEGAAEAARAARIGALVERALVAGAPVVGVYCSSLPDGAPCSSSSSSGAPARDDALSAEWAGVLLRQMDASGVIPQITAMLTPGAAPPAPLLISDFVFTAAMAEGGTSSSSPQHSRASPVGGISRRGPQLSGSRHDVGAGEDAGAWRALARHAGGFFRLLMGGAAGLVHQQLGLPSVGTAGRQGSAGRGTGVSTAGHSEGCCCCCGASGQVSGVRCGSSREAVLRLRELLSYLPACNLAPARQVSCPESRSRCCPALDGVAATLRSGHSVHPAHIISALADRGAFLELLQHPGGSCAVSFCRLGGRTLGVVVGPPALFREVAWGGAARAKVAQLVRFCDAFNIPLLTLLLPDQTLAAKSGAMPAAAAFDGARTLANLLFAYAEAGVPKLMICTTAAAQCAAPAKCLRSNVMLVWASQAAVAAAPVAASVSDRRLIRPRDTRRHLCTALEPLLHEQRIVACPKRKHALLPL